MSFEHGSIDLGIKNPFKFFGAIQALRGSIVVAAAVYLLFNVVQLVKAEEQLQGWTYAALGFILLAFGLKDLSQGLMRCFRFFVGRSVPTSLAANLSRSEANTAKQEQQDLAYDGGKLEQMLMGRKNLTFIEPVGWMARLAHTLFPKLTFLPYPIRNISQRMIDAAAKTLVALTSFTIVLFLVGTGLIETQSSLLLDVFALILLVYLVKVWTTASNRINQNDGAQMQATSSLQFSMVIALSFLIPVALVFSGEWLADLLFSQTIANRSDEFFTSFASSLNAINTGWFFGLLVGLAVLVITPLVALLIHRAKLTNPITEVSEARDNWQESVHPKEIFINIDNIIMANRRYKEVPNRVYRDLDPVLNQQTEAKGDFAGQMIQETQPAVAPLSQSSLSLWLKRGLTLLGNILLLAAIAYFAQFVLRLPETWQLISFQADRLLNANSAQVFASDLGILISLATDMVNILLVWLIVRAFGRLAVHMVEVFWAEITFSSTLIYFKCEGTFSESKVTTGTGVYDSTRSENLVVRSSITPWIIVSKIVTSTFAGVGRKNLEFSRYILEMHKNEQELGAILGDMKHFLGQRETIAAVKNDKDLNATDAIFQVNQQTRAQQGLAQDEKLAVAASAHEQHEQQLQQD